MKKTTKKKETKTMIIRTTGKASAHHPPRIVKCVDCGSEFETFGPGLRCPGCAKAHRKAYHKRYVRPEHRRSRQEEARKEALETERLIEAQKEAVKKIIETEKHRPAAETEVQPGRCPFCGRAVKGNARFCASCVRDGFSTVYELTGRTNGWDRRKRVVARLEDGTVEQWRGRKVAGNGALRPEALLRVVQR